MARARSASTGSLAIAFTLAWLGISFAAGQDVGGRTDLERLRLTIKREAVACPKVVSAQRYRGGAPSPRGYGSAPVVWKVSCSSGEDYAVLKASVGSVAFAMRWADYIDAE